MIEKRGMPQKTLDEILYHALRSIYLFEREEIERFGLTYQQMFLIKLLKRRMPLRVSDAARELRVPNFAASRVVAQLASRGLVVKARDASDRRTVFLRLTASGEEMVRAIESHVTELIGASLAGYSTRDAEVMLQAITDLDYLLGLREKREVSLSGTQTD